MMEVDKRLSLTMIGILFIIELTIHCCHIGSSCMLSVKHGDICDDSSDDDIDVPPLKQLGLKQIGDHTGIMQRCPRAAVFFDVKSFKEIRPRRASRPHV